MSSFARRVLKERVRLAVDDIEGERDARYPLPGSLAYWENQIERPLRGSGMDQATAERIAFALEQIALQLADTAVASQPQTAGQAMVAAGYAMQQPQQQQAFEPNPAMCRMHGKPWRGDGGPRGWYCATKLQDGSWCREKPINNPQRGAALP